MLFLKPIFIEKIWGGRALKKLNYQFLSQNIGEIIICGGIDNNLDSILESGVFDGLSLSYIWKIFPNLFNNFPSKNFPLLIKMISAEEDLSIQVHPTKEYGMLHNVNPKTEAWYILEPSKDRKIIYGHKAKDKEEFLKFLKSKNFSDLLNEIKIDKDDVLHLAPGTVHAIKSGTVLYEIQEPSLETYRLYDYDRVDQKTKQKRPLHINQALDNIYYSQKFSHPQKPILEEDTGNIKVFKLIETNYFITKKVIANCKKDQKLTLFSDYFIVLTMLDGNITFHDHKIIQGQTVILTKDELKNFYFYGNGAFLISAPIPLSSKI